MKNKKQQLSPVINMQNIQKHFSGNGVETLALSGINLEIYPGEYTAICGPSGCGKSTLLSLIGLLDGASQGSYQLNGADVSSLNLNQRSAIRNREIGFIFQNFNLIGDLNVFKNVELPLVYQSVPAKERKERVEAVLARVGMSERMAHFPTQLSGGQQQRTAVARALVTDPAIILADEPTGNLDSEQGNAIMSLLDKLHGEGATICLVTHDPRYNNYAERQINLLDGKIISENITDSSVRLNKKSA
ncbi:MULTISPECIES: ABC transporter ATP-binding protein [unclassified Colwellia]|uniref:ABC transporter ATP-binding protein n=1 Tax=unclassified Colwellia TaxID=196834 RepID=UPI0015F5E147|nr:MULTISPECIES: ABC transporter ATP-binding protein [unclassified Colwellia]MBA6233614.1 ABC transporter ATP-binding protein [Colwellia sp. MB02u-7]MBA6238174.1 ABC transporter ATP-binding protein [Colwellia sp. MB02u-11]MBA6255062.1 ABC transporter ATP-binding protein [Colwellia sp. MB3u-28]MBA6258987.1 ABC transporter ATP-binding protein [Colwellia sp. MB3u-41]MBA6299689.1 ABC transporter ATP-binding protein [Colwellia sp. MB3u-22]